MANETDDFFRGLGGNGSRTGVYFAPGVYDVEILDMRRWASQNPQPGKRGHRMFSFESRIERVISARAAEVVDGATRYPASNSVGERVSKILDLDGVAGEASAGEVTAILLACLRAKGAPLTSASDLTEAEWAKRAAAATPVGRPSPLIGAKIRVVCSPKATPTRAGKWISICQYEPIPG